MYRERERDMYVCIYIYIYIHIYIYIYICICILELRGGERQVCGTIFHRSARSGRGLLGSSHCRLRGFFGLRLVGMPKPAQAKW